MSLKLNILASWIAHAVMVAIGFYMVPFVRNTLPSGDYGVWVFVNSIAGYSSLLYMGLGATVCRFVANHMAREQWDDLSRFTSTTFAIYSSTALLVLLAAGGLAGMAPWIDRFGTTSIREVQVVILLNGLSTAIGMMGAVFGGVLIGSQRTGLKRTIEVSSGVLRFLLAMACLHWRPALTTLSVLFCTVTLVENLLLVRFAFRQVPQLRIRKALISRETLRETFSFSGYNAVSMIAEQLIYVTDTVVIGFALGTNHVEPYYFALRICQMIQEPLGILGEVALPRAGQLHARGDWEQLGRVVFHLVALSFVLVASFFVGASYFGDLLISCWIGDGLEQSHRLLIILLAAQIVAQPMFVLRRTMIGMGVVRTPAFIDIAEAMVNLVLSLILVQFWGIEGVAWGTFVPLVVIELAVFLPYACQQIRIRKRDLMGQVIVPCLFPLVCLWGFCEFVSRQGYPPRWLTLISVAVAGAAVVAVSSLPVVWLLRREVSATPATVPAS